MHENNANTLVTLKKRRDFLATARTQRRWVTPAFILQAMPGASEATPMVRVGFTASKKVGNAVVRNRVKRRLRETARSVLPRSAPAGWTFVVVGRGAALEYDFEKLATDMQWAIRKLASGADLEKSAVKGGRGHESSRGRA